MVWQTYLADSDIFVGPRQMPVPWCNSWTTARAGFVSRLPARVRSPAQLHSEIHLFLHQESKVSGLLKSNATLTSAQLQSILEAVGGALTGQSGRFVRYEVHTNQDEYNYLRNNGLWHRAGLLQFNQPISLPLSGRSFRTDGRD